MAFRQAASKHSEILAEHIDQPPVDRAAAGDHPVTGNLLRFHPEISAVMLDISVELFKAAFVQQHVDPLARGQFAFGVLRVDPLLATAHASGFTAAFHFGDIGGHSFVQHP